MDQRLWYARDAWNVLIIFLLKSFTWFIIICFRRFNCFGEAFCAALRKSLSVKVVVIVFVCVVSLSAFLCPTEHADSYHVHLQERLVKFRWTLWQQAAICNYASQHCVPAVISFSFFLLLLCILASHFLSYHYPCGFWHLRCLNESHARFCFLLPNASITSVWRYHLFRILFRNETSAELWKSHLQPHVLHKRESSFVPFTLGDLFDEL